MGAGVMGRSIASVGLERGLRVGLFDVDPAACRSALAWIGARCAESAGRLTAATQLDELGPCDVLIEAVVENRSIKRRVLRKMAELSPAALIATNTSSLSVGELAGSVGNPERFCGLHFCHPVRERPLVEVVPTPATAPATLQRACTLVQNLGKRPLQTKDVPGFVVNRLLFSYFEAALALVRGGVPWERIERAAVDFGMPHGPLEHMDEIGIDVILRAAAAFHRGTPVVPPQSELLLAFYMAGRLGRKSGAGFFSYSDCKAAPQADSSAVALAQDHLTTPWSGIERDLPLCLSVPLVSAATALLAEQVVSGPSAIPLAMRDGLGCRGDAADLTGWARRLGPAVLMEWIERLRLPHSRAGLERLLGHESFVLEGSA